MTVNRYDLECRGWDSDELVRHPTGDLMYYDDHAELIIRYTDLERLIATNCDPCDATPEDAEIIRRCHRRVFPENYTDENNEG